MGVRKEIGHLTGLVVVATAFGSYVTYSVGLTPRRDTIIAVKLKLTMTPCPLCVKLEGKGSNSTSPILEKHPLRYSNLPGLWYCLYFGCRLNFVVCGAYHTRGR